MSKARGLADLGNAYSDGALSNRNMIINGAMQVAQRGTSFTAQGYTLDRFYQLLSGGTATLTQETFALGSEVDGCSNFLKQVTSSGNDYCGIIHKVENVKSLPQGKATLSFHAKGTNPAAGSFQVVVYRMHDGTTTHDTLLDTTITLTSSWQKFTNSFDVGSLAGMTTPTANSLIYIAIRQSQSDSGTAAWELNLTGVQLEVGDTATPFEHRSYGDELARCQRYYEVISRAISTEGYGAIWSQPLNVFTNCWTNVEFKVSKRATPSFGLLGSAYWVHLTPDTILATKGAIVFRASGFYYLEGTSLGEPQAYVEAEL